MNKALRFRVLARDGFTCRYCGAKAPDVILHVDHIHPKSQGGIDRMVNLVTACQDCNLGKRDMVMDAALVALVSPTEPVAKTVKVRAKRRRRPMRRQLPKPVIALPLGFGHRHPYIGPDEPAPAWLCQNCAMVCTLEGDVCSCARPRFYCADCRDRLDDEDGYEDGLCLSCFEERANLCVECRENERAEDEELCIECMAPAFTK